MKKIFYVVYCNNKKIGVFEKKEDAEKYCEYLDFYSFNDEDDYWFRRELLCLK